MWGRLAKRQPDNLGVRLLLFDAAVQNGKDDAAGRCVGEIKRLEGEDGTWWRYAQAARLMARATRGDRSGLAEAAAHLTSIGKRQPGWLRLALLEAQVHELHGRPEEALEKYKEAVAQGDRQPLVVQRLVSLLYARQRYREADEVLQKLPVGAPVDGPWPGWRFCCPGGP